MRNKNLSALLLSGMAACAGLSGCGPYKGTATAFLSWHIVDPRDPDPLTAPQYSCEQKSVATVRLLLSNNELFDFPCNRYVGETPTPVPAGNYTVDVLAIGYNGLVLSQQRFTARLFGRTDLGHIIFQSY